MTEAGAPERAPTASDPVENLPVPQESKRCLGMLYYSNSLFDAKKGPLCAGLRRSLDEDESARPKEQSDAMPSGDFRYLCLGCAEYDLEGLRRASGRSREASVADVPLPRCIGVEAIASSAVAAQRQQEAAGVARGGAGAGARPPPLRPGRDPPPFPQPESDLQRFLERFQAHAARIAGRMVLNAQLMAEAARKGADAAMGWTGEEGKRGGGGR